MRTCGSITVDFLAGGTQMSCVWRCMVFVLAGSVLVACSSKVSLENYGKLRTGQSYEDVTKILGDPARCDEVLGIRTCVWVMSNAGSASISSPGRSCCFRQKTSNRDASRFSDPMKTATDESVAVLPKCRHQGRCVALAAYSSLACAARYSATPAVEAFIPALPLFQPAGQTSPCSSVNCRASTMRSISSTLRPSGRSFTT